MVYQWSLLYFSSQCSNVVYETTWSFIVKLHIEHPLEGGTKVCFKWSRSHDQDGRHLNIWLKPLQSFFPRTWEYVI